MSVRSTVKSQEIVSKATVRTRGPLKRELWWSLLAVVPSLVLFVVFVYYPLFSTLFYSFTDWNGLSRNFNFVGFANFVEIFNEKDIGQAFWNTIYFVVLGVPVGLLLQLLLAVLLTKPLKGRTILRTIIYVPAILSPIIVAFTWQSLLQYDGVVNQLLRSVGLANLAQDWLGDINTVKNTLVFITVWQYIGTGMVIFIAAINSIPKEINEAANLEGAVGFRLFRSVTLPLIMQAITIVVFLEVTGGLRIFELPLILTGGGPRNASNTIVLSTYNNAFGYERFGFASGLGFLFFIFIGVITTCQLIYTRRREVDY